VGPSADQLEVRFYEKWINAHYGLDGYEMTGLLDFRIKVNEDTGETTIKSVHVRAPFGDKIDSALNLLITKGTAIRRPLDVRAKKWICVYATNIVGGKSWDCAIMNGSNAITKPNLLAVPKAVTESGGWRQQAARFTTK